ncbi:hypothetical protein RHMOL_Rhmol11G0154800 [Rhododendron molle]|uniref:Uncharacterized protein n=2 Tax=Rhododendron molle TaxID=49168 RepID=A0ACC0LTS5_RHOML|nr:hypothetical protein RHMOL_Rhmol11G0154800 [Rhododendron molle]KAI8531682.1 hypothetical protein RHMOL_Rhmol11G0154800 [Rhododendron molle]
MGHSCLWLFIVIFYSSFQFFFETIHCSVSFLQWEVVMLGLDAAGKTTILYKLHIGEVLLTVPTIGMSPTVSPSLNEMVWFIIEVRKEVFLNSDNNDLRKETLDQQCEVVRRRTVNGDKGGSSHVMKYGNTKLGKNPLFSYLGSNPANDDYTFIRHDSLAPIMKAVGQRDAELLHFWHKYCKAPRGSQKKLTAEKQLRDAIKHRAHIDESMMSIAKILFRSANGLMTLETVRPAGKTYCGYCKQVKQLLSKQNATYKVVELDEENDGSEMQQALAELTGQGTVPNVFIGGKHIGGCDAVLQKHQRGELVPLLTEAGAISK